MTNGRFSISTLIAIGGWRLCLSNGCSKTTAPCRLTNGRIWSSSFSTQQASSLQPATPRWPTGEAIHRSLMETIARGRGARSQPSNAPSALSSSAMLGVQTIVGFLLSAACCSLRMDSACGSPPWKSMRACPCLSLPAPSALAATARRARVHSTSCWQARRCFSSVGTLTLGPTL